MTLRGQTRKYWGSVEATNHINDVTSMKDRLDVTFIHVKNDYKCKIMGTI